MLYHYEIYQLCVSSEIPIPELLLSEHHNADVSIRIVEFTEDIPADAHQLGPYSWGKSQEFWLNVPDVASFYVFNGNQITVQPAAGIDLDSVRVFLLGTAMGVLMFQRQFLVLHGNAVQVGNACMVCVGKSGAGKSTLAAELNLRGYKLLADDVVPVNSAGEAMPGFPRIKLWKDSADQLNIATDTLSRIRPEMEKFSLPAFSSMADAPLPVKWIYVLHNHNRDEFIFEEIRGMQRFPVLRDNTYRAQFMEGLGWQSRHLSLCAQLSSQVRVIRVTRPNTRFAPAELADRILENLDAAI